MANSRPTIEPFKGENFPNWKFRVEMLLSEFDVLECVGDQFQKSLKKADDKAAKKDAKAKNIIVQSVADSHLNILRGKATAYEMWRVLTETYEKKGLCGKLMIKRKMLGMKQGDSESIQDYIQRFDAVMSELASVDPDSIMKSEEVVCNFLMGVHPKFGTVVTIIENMDQDDVSLEFVKRRLQNEEEKSKSSSVGMSSSKPSAMTFHASKQPTKTVVWKSWSLPETLFLE